MKALIYEGPKKLTLQDIKKPIPKSDEVIIKVKAVGICGSELEGYIGHSGIRIPPLTMGHEFSGEIDAIGSHVKGVYPKQKVVVNPLIACGECLRCQEGSPNRCLKRKIIGIHLPGAFAEYVAVPAKSITVIPDSMDWSLASLAEPLAVCIHALKLSNTILSDVLIYGAGPIGLLTLQAAKQLGAHKVVVIDQQDNRLKYAEQLGAIVCKPDSEQLILQEHFSNGIDFIIDCVGKGQTREQAIRHINPGGKVILVGLGQDLSNLSINHVVRHEISLIGSYTYTDEDFSQAIELLAAGKISIEKWIVLRALEEGPLTFEKLVSGTEAASKVILYP